MPVHVWTTALVTVAAGCAYISDDELAGQFDQDGDGFDAQSYGGKDCDDTNRDVHPDAIEVCDGVDNDCDGDADTTALDLRTWYRDADEDGYGSPSSEPPALDCFPPEGYVGDATDCNDDPDQYGADINPRTVWYRDEDQDGYGDPDNTVMTCIQVPGLVTPAEDGEDDCDDSDPTRNPQTEWWKDRDGDGFGDPDAVVQRCWTDDDIPNNRLLARQGAADCDDGNADVYPGSAVLEDTLCAEDMDGDGYGNATPSNPRYESGNDCDDNNADIFPDANELWWDDQQNDCNSLINTVTTDAAVYSKPGVNLGDTLGKSIAAIGYFSHCNPRHPDCTSESTAMDIALGAPGESSLSASNGAVYFLNLTAEEPVFATLLGSYDVNRLGISLEAAGDLNEDGYDDVLIGTQDDYAYVLFGADPGDGERHSTLGTEHSSENVTVYQAAEDGDQLGFAVAGLEQFAGDGTPDIAMGAYGSNQTGDSSGRVYIFPQPAHTSTVNLNKIADYAWSDGSDDLNTDVSDGSPGTGTSDMTPDDEAREPAAPAVWVVEPDDSGTTQQFGWDIDGITDFNGDGAADLVIGAPGADFVLQDSGRMYMILGTPPTDGTDGPPEEDTGSGTTERSTSTPVESATAYEPGISNWISATDHVWVDGKFEGDRLGAMVSDAGDINGDGLHDIAVSAVGTPTNPTPGRLYIWFGSSADIDTSTGSLVETTADLIIEPDDSLGPGNFGFSFSPAGGLLHVSSEDTPGDLDGDGNGDMLIGSPEVADPGYDAGRVYLVYGNSALTGTYEIPDLVGPTASTASSSTGAIFMGDTPFQIGHAVSGAGDVTGDGVQDLLFGAPGADLTATGAGAVFLFSEQERE